MENNITTVMNMALEWEGIGETITFPMQDSSTENEKDTRKKINNATQWLIEQSIEKPLENILVHCNMGISRSITIVVRYLQIVYDMTYSEALKYIKTRRSFVKPNTLFKRILIKQDL